MFGRFLKLLLRKKTPIIFEDLERTDPVSRLFASERGTPIDRYYIDEFLSVNADLIRGRVLEVGGDEYCRRFGRSGDIQCDVLHVEQDDSRVTLVGDLADHETLPQGVQTQVGERGNRLSMGQRQLVSLLRVLVQQPAIFILDEATASIEPFTEWQIQQALDLILKNSTSILIAHRLSTIKAADRIIVLEDGGIIEEGNHETLLAGGGHYATLYNTYFRHQSLAYVEQSYLLNK